jgi:N,N'-diacetyllegionaminate synthase
VKHVEIGGRRVGPGEPAFIVVETGTTCNGDIDTALRMVDAAKDGGADAIKFQMIGADHFMSDRSVTYDYEWADGKASENMYEMFKGLEFSREDWARIRDYCAERDIVFYSSIDFIEGVDLGEELGMAAFKLSSWDAGNIPLIRRMARTGKPVQVDLGPTTLSDIETIVDVVRSEGNDQLVLVHCSHSLDDAGINVRTVPYLESVFGVPVGYSCDSRDSVPDIASVALGARLLEKRITLDRSYPGHHHVKALEPVEFAEWVQAVRRAETVLGDYAVNPSPEDLRQRELYFVSIVAEEQIPAGTRITREMLACKRPGTGIPPEYLDVIVGRTARRDLKPDELLSWEAV